MMMMMMIFFAEWLSNKRHLAVCPAGDSYSNKSDTPQAGFKLVQSLRPGFVECAAVITNSSCKLTEIDGTTFFFVKLWFPQAFVKITQNDLQTILLFCYLKFSN